MSDLNKIVDELSKLSVMEAAELSKLLQEKWGVSAAAPVAVAAAGGEAASADQAAAKDTFDVILTDVGDKKINIINRTNLENNVLINTQGIQEWIVPATGSYFIEAHGASGGDGGSSASQNQDTNGDYSGGLGAK